MSPPTKKPNKWLVAVSITFGTLMGTIDSSIVNVALPHIRGAVGATVEEITAISTSYIIANVLVMPLTGFLGRLFGQKRVYMACLALFILGSVLCGFASTLPALVLFRVLQGVGAGALQPTEQAILRQTFPKEEQGTAMALFAMAVMIGPAVGPTMGGWITDNYSWEWIFFINLPVGILGLFMVWNFVIESPEVIEANKAEAAIVRQHIDWFGIALLWIGLGTLQYILEEGSKNDWFRSDLILGMALFAGACLVVLVYHELTTPHPVLNLGLFRDPTYASGTLIGGVMFGMLMGSMFLLPLFMQELLGFTATRSGLVMMPRTLVMMVATPIVGKLYGRVHPGVTIAVGVVFFAIGSWQMSHMTLESGGEDIIGALATTGIGFSCLFVPLSTSALSNVKREHLADATGMNSLFRQIGGSIGLCIFASLQGDFYEEAHNSIIAHLTSLDPAATSRLAGMAGGMMGQGYDAVTAQALSVRMMAGSVMRQATMLSFERTFLLQGISFLFVIPLLLFLKVDRAAPPPKVDVHLE